MIFAVYDLINAAEIKRAALVNRKKVFGFLLIVDPFVEPGGRQNDALALQCSRKGFLLRRCLGSCVDQKLVVLKTGKAEHSRAGENLVLHGDHRRRRVTGKDLASLVCARIFFLHPVDQSFHLAVAVVAAE